MASTGRIGSSSLFVALGFALSLPHSLFALQFPTLARLPQASISSPTTIAPIEISGVVLNAETRQPISRALVRLGERGVLTNHDGVFAFPQVTTSSGALVVSKPGFFAGMDMADTGARIFQFTGTDSIVLTLYPEAILTGTATDASGAGLPNLSVVARRSTFDELGHHWRQADATRTRSDGTFRLALMAGDYSIQVRAMNQPRSGQEVYLPVSVPPESSSVKEAIHLRPGEVSEIHAAMESRKGYEVTFAEGSGSRRGFPRLTARSINGLTIALSPQPWRTGEETLSVVLPSGTYLLSGFSDIGGGAEEAETSITVPDHDISGIQLNFSKTPVLPVEVALEQSATSDNASSPTAQSLGLSLVSVAAGGDALEQSYQPNSQRDQTAAFSVPAGTYRLRGRAGGTWYATQADCGGTDLLSQNFVVTPGMGSLPIRVIVSNQTATLSGTATLAGQPAAAWVYLVSTTPSATPVVMLRAGSSGSFSRSNLPVGNYRVVALERRIGADFEDPATMAAFPDRAQSVTLTAGGQQTVSLADVPAAELPQ